MTLTDAQNEVKQRVLDALDKKDKSIITLRGNAGTGKTFTATEIIKDVLNDKNKSIIVIAPTNNALGVLRKKLRDIQSQKLNFSTLSSLISVPRQYVEFMKFKFNLDDVGMHELTNLLQQLKCDFIEEIIIRDTQMRFNYMTQSYEKEDIYIINKEKLHKALNNRLRNVKMNDIKIDVEYINDQPYEIREKLRRFDLLVIDEMPMVNEEEVELLKDAIRLSCNENVQSPLSKKNLNENTPIMCPYPVHLFAGDHSQLRPIQGKPNQYMTNEAKGSENDIYQLNEILRSTDKISKIGRAVNKGTSFENLARMFPEQIQFYKNDTETFIKENIEDFANSNITITFENKNVRLLNDLIREHKGFASSKDVKEGEQIIVTSSSKTPDCQVMFANGEEYIVEKIYSDDEAEELLLKDDNSIFTKIRQRSQDNEQFKEIFDYAKVIVRGGDFKLVILNDGEVKKYAWLSSDLNYNKSFAFDQSMLKLNDLAMINGHVAPVVNASFGYARTVHKAQGSEWDAATILLTKRDLYITRNRTNLPYTAITRPKNNLKVFVEK